MASDDDRIRLPELPIFKKYSLALRQEFASPKDLLAALERSATKVERELEKANSRRRKQVAAESPADAPEHESAHETPPEAAIDELAPLQEQAKQSFLGGERGPAQEDFDDLEATSVFDEIDEAVDADAIDTPIWEPEPVRAKPGPQAQISRPAPKRKRRNAASSKGRRSAATRPKRKRPAPRIEVVPVSSQGRPLATGKNSRARSATKRKTVTARRKSSGRRKG